MALLCSPALSQQGPGLGNLVYTQKELGKPVGIVHSRLALGHSRVAMHRGYLVLFYSKDGGEGDGGFSFLDVSNPRAPVLVHDEYNADTKDIREAHGFSLRGDIACIQSHTGMQFWDFSDITKPRKLSSISLPGINLSDYDRGMWWTHWQGRYVYGGGTGSGLYIVDAEDPANPKFVKSIPIREVGGFRIGSTHAIGNLLYLTGFDTGPAGSGISILDISDPVNPQLVTTTPGGISAYSSLVNGNKLVLSARNRPLNGGVVFDVSDPVNMRRVGLPLSDSGGGGYVGFGDGYAFVGIPEHFKKIDMSHPDYPVVMRGFSGVYGADDGFITPLGNVVFLGNDHGTGSTFIPHQTGRDSLGPVVNMVVPRDGAVHQARSTRIGVTFTDMVDGQTLDTVNFKIRPLGGGAIDGYFAHQTGIVNFHPKQLLLPDTTYEVIVRRGGVKDYSGNTAPVEFRSTFRTAHRVVGCRMTQSADVSIRRDSVAFSLACEAGAIGRVAWDFGDGRVTAPVVGQIAFKHAYLNEGVYNVFAYVENHDTPVSQVHTAIAQPTFRPPTRASTLLLDAERSRLWNVNADQGSVTVTDSRSLTKIREITVGRAPRTLSQDRLGRVWVANQDDATLTVIGTDLNVAGTVRLPPGSRPYGVALVPGGDEAYVTLEATDRMVRIQISNLAVTGQIQVFRRPRGIAINSDGNKAFITRFISPDSGGQVAEIKLSPFSMDKVIPLAYDNTPDHPNGGSGIPNALASVTISPDGRSLWVPFKKDNVRRGLTVDPIRGASNTFESTVRTGLGRISIGDRAEIPGTRLDFDNRSLANAVTFDSRGIFAYVTTGASNHTVVVNALTGKQATAIEPSALQSELAPDGLVVDARDSVLYIHYHMSRQIAAYDISEIGKSNLITRKGIASTVAKEALSPEILRGKQIFFNASDRRMSRDGYMSCVVCHMDGGGDGRVWDFTHRGEGLRRTTTLLGRAGVGQGPLHWSANFDEVQDFEHDIRDAFAGEGFMDAADFAGGDRNLPLGGKKAGFSADLDALSAYLTSLNKARPSPYRNTNGSMTSDAVAGEKIFNRADVGCAICHVPGRYTNSGDYANGSLGYAGLPALPSLVYSSVLSPQGFLLHDVGTLRPSSGMRSGAVLEGLDVPSLMGVWEGGPYLHNGSAATLMDVLTTANPQDRHGRTSQLTQTEKDQLVAFLTQLDEPASTPPVLGVRKSLSALNIRKSGSGYAIFYEQSAPRGLLSIHDVRGKQLAALRPARVDGSATQFLWMPDALHRGAYYLRLTENGRVIADLNITLLK